MCGPFVCAEFGRSRRPFALDVASVLVLEQVRSKRSKRRRFNIEQIAEKMSARLESA